MYIFLSSHSNSGNIASLFSLVSGSGTIMHSDMSEY